MAQITVYHGSDHVVKNPVYLGGKEDNDYDNGFYMTEYEERARSWAALNGDPEHAIVNIYHLDIDQLKVVDLNDCGVLAWIAEIAANRGTEQEATEAFLQNQINVFEVERLFYKGALGNQIFLKYFLSQRTKAILLEGYEVPGVTARYAIQNRLVYEKESGGYADTSIR